LVPHPDDLAVTAHEPVLVAERLAGPPDALRGLESALAVVRVDGPSEQGGVGLPLARGVAEQLLDLWGRVDVRVAEVERADVPPERQLLHEGPGAAFRLPELLLRLRALAFVADESRYAASLGRVYRRRRCLVGKPLAVLPR